MAKSPETELPVEAFGWAASDTSGTLAPFHFSRRFFILLLLLSLFITLISLFVGPFYWSHSLTSRAEKMALMTSLSRFSSAGFATRISTLSKTTGVSPLTLSFLGILLSLFFTLLFFYYKKKSFWRLRYSFHCWLFLFLLSIILFSPQT